jgi:hypothetical protein
MKDGGKGSCGVWKDAAYDSLVSRGRFESAIPFSGGEASVMIGPFSPCYLLVDVSNFSHCWPPRSVV